MWRGRTHTFPYTLLERRCSLMIPLRRSCAETGCPGGQGRKCESAPGSAVLVSQPARLRTLAVARRRERTQVTRTFWAGSSPFIARRGRAAARTRLGGRNTSDSGARSAPGKHVRRPEGVALAGTQTEEKKANKKEQ